MATEIKTIEQRLAEKARQELRNAVQAIEKKFWSDLGILGINWPSNIEVKGFMELDNGGEPISSKKTVRASKFIEIFMEAAIKEGETVVVNKAHQAFIDRVDQLTADVEEIRNATGV